MPTDGDEEALPDFAKAIINKLCTFLEDASLSFIVDPPDHESASSQEQDSSIAHQLNDARINSNAFFKFSVVHDLWNLACKVIPHSDLSKASEKILSCLVKCGSELADNADKARNEWAAFCTDVLLLDADGMEAFWESRSGSDEDEILKPRSIAALWRSCAKRWKAEVNATWESSVFLLGLPFA